jgi:uncharacterized protein (TIRG00374 family)
LTTGTKKRVYFVIGLSISAVLVWALFRNIDTQLLLAALKQANYWWFAPMIVFIAFTMYQRAYRWRVMLAPIKRVKFPNLLAATCIGFMANNVLPLRMGEFVRAYSLATQDKELTKSASLATIFVERMVFDLVALLVIFGGVLTFSSSLKDHIDQQTIFGIYISIAIAFVGLTSMILLAVHPKKVGDNLAKYLFFLPDNTKEFIKAIVLRFSRGLEFLRDYKAVISVTVQTLLIWILMGIANYFVFAAFDFDLPLDAAFVLLVVVSISILLPSSPGFVGVYHVGVVWSLAVYGIEKERALSCAIVLHVVQYLVITIMGFYFLKKEHLSLKELEEEAAESGA